MNSLTVMTTPLTHYFVCFSGFYIDRDGEAVSLFCVVRVCVRVLITMRCHLKAYVDTDLLCHQQDRTHLIGFSMNFNRDAAS